MIIVLSVLAGIFIFIIGFGFFISGPVYRGPVTDHFNGKTFINPGNRKAKGLASVLKWMFARKRSPWIVKETSFGEKPPGSVHAGIRVTFVNHSTFLIQFDGINILTDPVWSERTSPFSWAGPKRMRNPGVRFEDLPRIHAVLLSHNHYDHLDIDTLKKLRDAHQPKIFTALGVKAFLDKEGISRSEEMDWWDELPFQDLVIQSVPAQHFSGRGTFDRDATLWCGFVIRRRSGNIYFAGDTGYNNTTFKEIGTRCSPIDVALVPIGAYKPVWFMSPIHCSPAEAVEIHHDVHAQLSIASHFGTFQLADDAYDDAIQELHQAMREAAVPGNRFLVLEEGVGKVIYSA